LYKKLRVMAKKSEVILDKKTFIKLKRKEEFAKCKKDPIYFMKKYCKIAHPQRGIIPFELYPFQENVVQQLEEHRLNIILKSRQLGISTLTAGYALWKCLFVSGFNVIVIATKSKVASALVKKVRVMYNGLPDWMKDSKLGTNRTYDNVQSQEFGNESKITAETCSEDAGRSGAASLLLIDEAAFIKERLINDLWSAAWPTLSTGGSAVILSTPNGEGGFFHKKWTEAEVGDNDFNPIKLHWTVHPERGQDWRDAQTRQLGVKLANQECECEFTSSGETVIEGDIVKWYEEHENIIEPLLKKLRKKFFQYTEIDPTKSYIIPADVARGDGTDSSAFHILDAETLEQCAEFKDQLPPTEYALLLYSIAKDWNNALLIVENTGLGWSVIEKLIELDYENLYYSIKGNPHPDPNMYLRKGIDLLNNDSMVPGFSNTSKSRPLIIEKFISIIESKEVIIRSKRLLNEIKVFVWKNGKAQARSGYNDDLIMSYAIGVFVQAYALKIKQASIDLTKATLNSFGKDVVEQKEQIPLIFSSGYNRANPWKMNNGRGTEDITWLLNKKSN